MNVWFHEHVIPDQCNALEALEHLRLCTERAYHCWMLHRYLVDGVEPADAEAARLVLVTSTDRAIYWVRTTLPLRSLGLHMLSSHRRGHPTSRISD